MAIRLTVACGKQLLELFGVVRRSGGIVSTDPVGGSPPPAPNSLRRKPGATAESGLTDRVGRGRLAGDAEVHREQALVAPAAEQRPEQRNLREGVVEAVGRHEGARRCRRGRGHSR